MGNWDRILIYLGKLGRVFNVSEEIGVGLAPIDRKRLPMGIENVGFRQFRPKHPLLEIENNFVEFLCFFLMTPSLPLCCLPKGYGWLKDRILGEGGRRQQGQLREIAAIAERLGCSPAQLAIGT